VTTEQRQNSVHWQDRLYATLDFHPPDDTNEDIGTQKDWKILPFGWEFSPDQEEIRNEVIGAHKWGTQMLIVSGGKAFHTLKGQSPGKIVMIWDTERQGNQYRPLQRGGLSKCSGRVLIRTKEPCSKE